MYFRKSDETREVKTIYHLHFDDPVAFCVVGRGLFLLASSGKSERERSFVSQTFETKPVGTGSRLFDRIGGHANRMRLCTIRFEDHRKI